MMAIGCGGSPAAPDTSQSATASGYTVSGVVTNDGGAPLAGARVTLDHGDNLPDLNPTTQRVVTSTGPDGRYSLFLRPDQVRSGYSPFAIIRAETLNSGVYGRIRTHAQLLDGQGTSSVKNFRLRPYRPVALGDSIEVTIDSETPLCDIDGLSVTTICDVVHGIHHTNARNRTLTIEARPLAATVIPTVRTWGRRAGQGTLTVSYPFTVDIDDIPYPFSIAIEVPLGTPPQQYELVTRVN